MSLITLPYRDTNPGDSSARSASGLVGDLDAIATGVNGQLDATNFKSSRLDDADLASPNNSAWYCLPLRGFSQTFGDTNIVESTNPKLADKAEMWYYDAQSYVVPGKTIKFRTVLTFAADSVASGSVTAKLRYILTSAGGQNVTVDSNFEYGTMVLSTAGSKIGWAVSSEFTLGSNNYCYTFSIDVGSTTTRIVCAKLQARWT